MVSVLLKGYNFSLDIYELLKVYFPYEEIIEIDNQKVSHRGYFISINLESIDDKLYVITSVYYNEKFLKGSKENINDIDIRRNKEKSIRIGIKKSIFNLLIDLTDRKLPWGILTGIRPVKIVHELMKKNTAKSDIFKILTNEYKLNIDKANLIMNVAQKQMDYIYPINKDKYSLYVGIPFCPTRCSYCSFPTMALNKYVDEYIEKLIYEIISIKDVMHNKSINTVYIGGGTPTSIPTGGLERIIKTIYNSFGEKNIKEFTVEAGRPDTIDLEVLEMLKRQNIGRISINPQTMNDETLKKIGRNHTTNDILNAYKMAKEIGIDTINMDLIVGLPGEGVIEIKNTLNLLERLNPDNVTVHTLSVKKGSDIENHIEKFDIKGQDVIEKMLFEASTFAKKMNLEPYYLYRQKHILGNYENIGYAKKDKECLYNISIMEEKETIVAAGLGAVTKIYYPDEDRLERIPNFKDLINYFSRIDELIDKKRKLLK